MAMVSAPTTVQFDPSVETDDVNVLPARDTCTQYGAVPAPPAVLVDTPFADTRRWKASPFAELTTIIAWRAPGVTPSRIITPALVHAFSLPSVATRATIEP